MKSVQITEMYTFVAFLLKCASGKTAQCICMDFLANTNLSFYESFQVTSFKTAQCICMDFLANTNLSFYGSFQVRVWDSYHCAVSF